MKITITVLMLLIYFYSSAEECSSYKTDKLEHMVSSKVLGEKDVKHGKLVKFTHHDYPISCHIKLSSGEYRWFTDDNENRFIIEKKTAKSNDYYGLFK